MTKKSKGRKRKGHGSQTKQSTPTFDRRAMEGIMQQMLPGATGAASSLESAQQIMYQAFDAESSDQRVALAHKALEISSNCADAYVLLAEQAATLPAALRLYEQAVAAGERALGEEGFREYQGHFWGFLETRPYMRARQGLADCLWATGRRAEAVEHCHDMLRLNPNDNQGIRYRLASMLLDLKRHDELEQLLGQYDEDEMAEWVYTRALLVFRQEGDGPRARRLLANAQQINAHVPAYLTGANRMPPDLPESYTWGGEDEAILYAAQHLPAWKNTSGATSWLRKTLKVPSALPPEKKRMPWRQYKVALHQLPQYENDIWEVDLRAIEAAGTTNDPADKPWALVLTNATEGEVLVLKMLSGRPKDQEVWDQLLEAMRRPSEDDPHRPAEIHVGRKTWFKAWTSKLAQIGVTCRLSEPLEHVDYVFAEIIPQAETFQRLASNVSDSEHWPDAAELPQFPGEIWQADIRRLPNWIEVGGEPMRPWVLMVADVSNDLILATELVQTEPDAEWFWQGVQKAICAPVVGEPHLPGVIEVATDEYREPLAASLEPSGVRCVTSHGLDAISRLVGDLADELFGPQQLRPLVDSPGMTSKQVGSFFAAAAEFYRSAPWRDVPYDSIIQIDCDQFDSGPWFAVVMGQSGMELGVALYEDLGVLRTILTGALSDEETARRTAGLSVTYDEAFAIAPPDLDAAELNDWPVAGPEAYPSAIRINPGMAIRTPLTWELELLTSCLRAIPDFLQEGTVSTSMNMAAATGTLTLQLAWTDRA